MDSLLKAFREVIKGPLEQRALLLLAIIELYELEKTSRGMHE